MSSLTTKQDKERRDWATCVVTLAGAHHHVRFGAFRFVYAGSSHLISITLFFNVLSLNGNNFKMKKHSHSRVLLIVNNFVI